MGPAGSSGGSCAVPISEQQRVAGIPSLSVVQEKVSLFLCQALAGHR